MENLLVSMCPSTRRTSALSMKVSKAASSAAPRPHLSVHYPWWTLTGTITLRQSGQTRRLRFDY